MGSSAQWVVIAAFRCLVPLACLAAAGWPSAPAYAQTYCYNPTTRSCFPNLQGYCDRTVSVPWPESACRQAEEQRRAEQSTSERCCYNAATGQAYVSRSQCGVREQTIGLNVCRIQATQRPWCLRVGQRTAFRSDTNTCPGGTLTLSEEEARPFR